MRDSNNQPKTKIPITVELFDMMRISRTKVEIKDNKAIFSFAGLRKGIYVLKIYIDDQIEAHHVELK